MKKLLIVNNNMKVGGVQKSLYNLLWSLDGRYEISLYLFRNTGQYADKLPPRVRIIEDHSLFSYLGRSQAECAHSLKHRLTRGVLAALCRVLGRSAVMKLLLLSKRKQKEEYDCAIAFLHNGNSRNFYGGVQDFVLHRVRAKKKVAFLHCDYADCGAHDRANDRLIASFDKIAACSEGCRRVFVQTLPHLKGKSCTVHNCHRFEEIRALAQQEPVVYGKDRLHVLMVCRMAHEKGVERAIRAARTAVQKGISLTLHLVGDGAMRKELCALCTELQMDSYVRFYGEEANPYRYMTHADLFLISSYHEAAPMVIEEAACLCLPVLSVKTTSSEEMVESPGRGWVCENSQSGLEEALIRVLSDPRDLALVKETLRRTPMDNQKAIEEFVSMAEN